DDGDHPRVTEIEIPSVTSLSKYGRINARSPLESGEKGKDLFCPIFLDGRISPSIWEEIACYPTKSTRAIKGGPMVF
ncbi:hypothetical protein Tco_0235458, partial [Tanacetum coccineum]